MADHDPDSTPAIAAPPGYTSNLDHPYNLHSYTVITVVLSLVTTIPLVIARLFTRVHLHREVNPEDWLLVAAEVTFVGFLGLLVALPSQGAHEWDVSLSAANQFAFLVNILELLYIIPLLLSKIALIVQLKRIFTAGSSIRHFAYWALQTLIAVNIISYTAIIIWAVVYITHQNQDFDPNCTGECHNSNYVLVATGILNATVDLTTISVPLYAIRRLQMSWRKKLGVGAVFGIGALACAASILRAMASFGPINNQLDQTYTSFPVFYWGAAEIAAVIAATSVPCLPKLWKEAYKRINRYTDRDINVRRDMNYPLYSRHASRLSRIGTFASVGRSGIVLSGRRKQEPENLVADRDVALIQDRMRGLGLGMGTTQSVVGGCSPVLSSAATIASTRTGLGSGFWSRGRSRRSSLESGLREMPVPGSMPQQPSPVVVGGSGSRRPSGGILKTVEVEISSL